MSELITPVNLAPGETLCFDDEELRDLIPPLSQDEQSRLEQSVLSADGATDPIIFWREPETGLLLIADGYHRYDICSRWSLPYPTAELHLPDRNSVKIWMLERQLGRRNLTDAQRVKLTMAILPLIEAQNQAKRASSLKRGDAPPVSATFPYREDDAKNRESEHPLGSSDDRKSVGQVAKIAGTKYRTTAKIIAVEKEGDEQTKADMEAGKISVNAAYRKVRKPKPAAELPAPLDEVGQPLMTDHLMATFGTDRDTLDAMRNSINAIERNGETLFNNGFAAFLPGGAPSAFKRDCNNVRKAIKFMVPYAVCPYCTGDEESRAACNVCRCQGWVNKDVWDHIPPEAKGGK